MSDNPNRPYERRVPKAPEETWRTKLADKTLRNPFVPFGAALTFLALVGGLAAFHRKNASLQQRFMRARVMAQGATVAALAGGGIYHALKGGEDFAASYDTHPKDKPLEPRSHQDSRF